MSGFYNTIGLSDSQKRIFSNKSNKQERDILQIFMACKSASPWEMYVLYNRLLTGDHINCSYPDAISKMRQWKQWHWDATLQQLREVIPITSIRRAMTNLTELEALVKTDKYRIGPKGQRETIWEYTRV